MNHQKETNLTLDKYLKDYSATSNHESLSFISYRARYEFVTRYIKGDEKVIDLGCGEGWGAAFLSTRVKKVVAIDMHSKVIERAQKVYCKKNLIFQVDDVQKLNINDETIDIVCAFEIIEHIQNDRLFLQEMKRILKPGGILFISTPNRLVSLIQHNKIYKYHIREYLYSEFYMLINSLFEKFEIYGQAPFVVNHLRKRVYKFRDIYNSGGLRKMSRILDRSIRFKQLKRIEKELPGQLTKFTKDNVDLCYNFVVVATR